MGTYPPGMDELHGGAREDVRDGTDTTVYGIAWMGLLAAAVGVVVGVAMVLSEDESGLLGVAAIAVSASLGVLTYLVTKLLDRH